MNKQPNNLKRADFRLVIVPAGSIRSEAELRKDVRDALEEATQEFRKERGIKDVQTEGNPQGGFLGLGVEWAWIISIVSPIAWELIKGAAKAGAEEVGKESAKGLFSFVKKALRKRNLSANDPERLPSSPGGPSPRVGERGKSGTAKNKQRHTVGNKPRQPR